MAYNKYKIQYLFNNWKFVRKNKFDDPAHFPTQMSIKLLINMWLRVDLIFKIVFGRKVRYSDKVLSKNEIKGGVTDFALDVS